NLDATNRFALSDQIATSLCCLNTPLDRVLYGLVHDNVTLTTRPGYLPWSYPTPMAVHAAYSKDCIDQCWHILASMPQVQPMFSLTLTTLALFLQTSITTVEIALLASIPLPMSRGTTRRYLLQVSKPIHKKIKSSNQTLQNESGTSDDEGVGESGILTQLKIARQEAIVQQLSAGMTEEQLEEEKETPLADIQELLISPHKEN
ncbi:unnamed protein product, partial [Timema podura]|nr:unnamed protein product [Timema podura]